MEILKLAGGVLSYWLFGDAIGKAFLSVFPESGVWGFWCAKIMGGGGLGLYAADLLILGFRGDQQSSGGIGGVLRKVLQVVVGVFAAVVFGGLAGQGLQRIAADIAPKLNIPWLWPGRIVAFFLGMAVFLMIGPLWKSSGSGKRGGGWGLVFRPVKGFFAQGLLLLTVGMGSVLLMALLLEPVAAFRHLADEWEIVAIAVLFAPAGIFFMVRLRAFRFLGEKTAFLRRVFRQAQFGKGGSGEFGGMLAEWENLFRKGDILIGSSSYDKQWRIGLSDDRHLLTIAATRGGKGRSAIIPNLILWPHSALVIDPKGTNAAVTARRRGMGGGRVTRCLGQDVFVVDPFGDLKRQGVDIESACFNPLDALDPDSDRIFEDIKALADGLLMPSPKTDPHWDQKAKGIIAGMIAHVITTEPPEKRTLLRVRDMLLSTSPAELKVIVQNMMRNDMAAGLAREAGADILRAEDSEEMRNIYSNVQKSLEWLLSIPMRKTFARSDFSLSDLKDKPTTIYLVLPPDELDTHARFLRLFVSAALRTILRRDDVPKPRQKVLFVLDEFLALGRMDRVLNMINVGASYGLKIWPIVQNVNGLLEHYGENWQTFVDGAAAVQVFSIGNKPSADFLAGMIGERLVVNEVPGRQGMSYQLSVSPLRTGGELQEEVDRNWGKQVVIRPGRQPLYLNRVPYDKAFQSDQYSPDPDHPGS